MIPRYKGLLRMLSRSGREWNRPMDIGGADSSSHSKHLSRLIGKGYVERQRRNSICNTLLKSARGSYEYRITEKGRQALIHDEESK